MTDFSLYLNGAWTDGTSGRCADIVNPATEAVVDRVAMASQDDLEKAVAGVRSGFEEWSETSPVERGRVLREAAANLKGRADEIAPVLTRQQGKTLFESKFEIIVAADVLEWFAEEARRGYGRLIPSRVAGVDQMVLKEPIGPVAGFVPWNFGLGQAARKVGAALAAGCSMVLKGPEVTPACCAVLVEALLGAGLPPRALALVFGVPAEISQFLIPHPAIRKVSFTGSTAIGKELAAMAGRNMKPITMELGGHAPAIVEAGVDIAATAKALAASKYRNVGQVCLAPTRFLIAEEVYEPFLDAFTEAARAIKVGDGAAEGTTMGPLANKRRLDAMQELIEDATDRGAKVQFGGRRIGNQGYFFEPTILTDVPNEARLMNEEPFGPIALMRPTRSLDEALEEANRLPYALAAYAFTGSGTDARRIYRTLQAGIINVNNMERAFPEVPYGGMKDSGYGSEGGVEAIDAYLTTKYVAQSV